MTQYTAFEKFSIVATGDMTAMIAAQRAALSRGVNLLIYDDATGQVRDVDLRTAPPPPRGRPKMGVKAREVTLLPRHWAWLADQKGGASATLRNLVDDAMWAQGGRRSDAARQKTAYAFLGSIAGDLPGFEAMTRVLFASDWDGFAAAMVDWPMDVRRYALRLASLRDAIEPL
ncbi:MAG: DUF2239 family protein [Pseudomonadota bacterium]